MVELAESVRDDVSVRYTPFFIVRVEIAVTEE